MRRHWTFLALLGVQTVGAGIMYWNVIPLYRRAIAGGTSFFAELETSILPLVAIALVQVAYWISRSTRAPLPQYRNAFVGQLILFLARMGFVLPTSIFGFLFITADRSFDIGALRYAVILAGLFSLYCYVQDLERLGRAFIPESNEDRP
jgi:hypothetical protein